MIHNIYEEEEITIEGVSEAMERLILEKVHDS